MRMYDGGKVLAAAGCQAAYDGCAIVAGLTCLAGPEQSQPIDRSNEARQSQTYNRIALARRTFCSIATSRDFSNRLSLVEHLKTNNIVCCPTSNVNSHCRDWDDATSTLRPLTYHLHNKRNVYIPSDVRCSHYPHLDRDTRRLIRQ